METLFLKLANLSITASWLILAVLLIRLVFRKAPKWVFCILWGLVALRLICPISIESALSLIPSAEPLPQDILYTAVPRIQSGVEVIDDFVNPVLADSMSPALGASANPSQIWSFVLSRIWAAGTVVMLLYALISYLLLRRRVATATLFSENIKQSESVASPFVLGFFRPVIYLPYSIADTDINYVIAHEKAHIRRKDHWWKPVGFILLAVYWFNPLLWAAYVLLCRDIEAACDEKVIREMEKEDRRAYSTALLHCSVRHRGIAACPLAFGETGVKGRIKDVMNYKKPAFWILVLAVAVCVAVAVCFLTVPVTDVRNPWTQGYMPGTGNILGNVDNEKEPTLWKWSDYFGTSYVSWQCLYMNSLSSNISNDSGYRYEIGKDSFSIISLRRSTYVSDVFVWGEPESIADSEVSVWGELEDADVSEVSEGREVDYAGRHVKETIPVSKWEWQEFPYTDEEWRDLFWPQVPAPIDILALYKEILYQPLNNNKFLLFADGDLLIVELHKNPQKERYIWSIYSLVNEANMGVAQWEYAPELSSRLPAFRFEFDMEYAEIFAICTSGKLIDFDSQSTLQTAPSDNALTLPKGNAIYWSPLNEADEIEQASDTVIYFYCTRDNGSQFSGTIYITAGGNSNGRTVYTATLVGTGLHLSPNVETEGGVISLFTTDSEFAVIKHDMRDGKLELTPTELSQYVFYTNSEKIAVTVNCDGDFEGTVILRDISQNNTEIARKDVSKKDRKVVFTNLTSARLYRIEYDGVVENCTVVVSPK